LKGSAEILNKNILLNASNEYFDLKYPEEFYNYHLKVLKESKHIDEKINNAIRNLFLWKLGKISNTKTDNNIFTGYQDLQGQYYYANTTGSNKDAIKKATDKEILKEAVAFRDEKLDYNKFKLTALGITAASIVLPTFYIHIWKPYSYPIIDKNVWKAYCKEIGRPVSKYTMPRSTINYEEYIKFFNKLVLETGLSSRIADQSLWVIGSRL
jgi:hypothetical protein